MYINTYDISQLRRTNTLRWDTNVRNGVCHLQFVQVLACSSSSVLLLVLLVGNKEI